MASFLGLTRILLLSLFVSFVAADDNTYGGCQNPKVRREWRKISDDERAGWIKAVNCLTTLPHDPSFVPVVPANVSLIPPLIEKSSFYDDLVYLHMDLNTRIHFDGQFLPWHRHYLHYFETVLTEKCGYQGVHPYWDWTQEAADAFNSPFFDTSANGVGGWGKAEDDFQVYNGGFKDWVRVYPSPHHIRRNFSVYPFSNPALLPPWGNAPDGPPRNVGLQVNATMTKTNVDYVVNNFEGNYMALQSYFESANGTHIGAHLLLGGDMTGHCPANSVNCVPGPKWTPNDPLFFLHHAMVDKIWHDWQNKSPRNKYAFGGGSAQATSSFASFISYPNGLPPYMGYDSLLPSDGLWGNVTVWDVIDTKAGELCYTYE